MGLHADPTEHLATVTHTYTHATVELHAWLCVLTAPGEPSPIEVEECRWVPADELPVPGFLEGNTPIIDALRERLGVPPRAHPTTHPR